MSAVDPALELIEEFKRGGVSYPQFVLRLERAVDLREAAGLDGADDLRRQWGQLEIINALSEGGAPAVEDAADVDQIIEAIRLILAPGT